MIDVSNKNQPIKVAEWNNPPAGFHNQDLHVDCDWENAPAIYAREECHLFLYGADPYPEMLKVILEYFTRNKFSMFLWASSQRPDVNDETKMQAGDYSLGDILLSRKQLVEARYSTKQCIPCPSNNWATLLYISTGMLA